ncbi:MAG TPA: LamG-like jellyroll fold domain-containing protein, partial [Patescibacteria group bacterium]|nr:LamG-like jellyroll fold domain-containing protein [Patescibacteria group bacterium]
SDFSLSGGAYTVYLASGPVSSDDDEDIIDKVGYGDATYFKTSPAPAILDNHLLIRKAKADSSADSMVLGGVDYLLGSGFNSNNNALDFVLINLEVSDNEDQEEPFIPGQDNDGEFFNYCIDPGLYLGNIIHLWHFDECLASSTFDFADNKILPVDSIWRAGKFGCALEQNHQQGSVSTELDSSFDSNNFSLSFYYQNLADNSRPTITFSNSVSGNFFRIQLYPSYTDFYNFPQQIERRDRDLIWIDDASWHLFTLVVNKPENYWAIYRDGEEIKRVEMKTKKFIEVDRFSLKGDNYNNLADELVIFNRALSPNEVRQINEADIPLNTKTCRTISPQTPEIIHYWSFDENLGNIAYDVVGQSHMSILPEARIIGDSVNNYLKVSSAFPEILVDLVNPSPRTDLALAFWWKSNDLSQNNSLLKLMTNNENLFGLNINHGSWYYYFNNMNIRASNESLVPNDGFWHNIVLSYSSYWMKLNIFVDGELKASIRRNWLYNKSLRKMLIKSLEGSHYLDEISIWNWSLNLADVKT